MKSSLVPILALANIALAADCLQDQERRSGDPTGEQIAKALASNSILDNVCAGNWRTGDSSQLENSFNHWSIVFEVKRTDNTKDLNYCKDAFNNILEQCVTNGNSWGGSWSLGGETYTISNSIYPENGLAPTDDGGPSNRQSSSSSSGTSNLSHGPITVPPQTTTATGAFATSTATIEGLTANSATTTSTDSGPTILPIWYVSPGVGIILVPGAGVGPGGVIPPPPGYPPLTIGEDGNPSTKDGDHSATATTTTTETSDSTSSSCTSCSSCIGFEVLSDDATATLENDGDPDLPTIDPNIWSSMETKYPLPSGPEPTTSESNTPTQSASPIDQPGCQDTDDTVKDDLHQWTSGGNGIRLSDKKYYGVNDILYKLREVVCDGSCAVPSGIDDKYVAVSKDGGRCEISVALSANTEIYVNRDTWPESNDNFNNIWQQCWDSTDHIINKCVKNEAKAGWWNGNHVYQFYAAGLRPLNSPESHHVKDDRIELKSFLEPPAEGLSCSKDCCGYIPNTSWCIENCGGVCKRSRGTSLTPVGLLEHGIAARATQSVKSVTPGCELQYILPDYPSSGVAAKKPEVQKFYDRNDATSGNNNCDNPRLDGPVAEVTAHKYDTEHVYEKHIIKRFLFFLIGGQQVFDEDEDEDAHYPVATCLDIQSVFSQLNGQGTHFRKTTAAQQLAEAVSCYGAGCPYNDDKNNRLGEFFLLRKEVNGMKNRIFTGFYNGTVGQDSNNNKLPSCNPIDKNAVKMQQQMINAAMVFQYMNKQEVFNAFNVVHQRIIVILQNLDADALTHNRKPRNLRPYVPENSPITWEAAYIEFMNRFLVDSERKMGLWLFNCRNNYYAKAGQDAALKNKVANYATGNGVYADGAMKLSGIWDGLKGGQMT